MRARHKLSPVGHRQIINSFYDTREHAPDDTEASVADPSLDDAERWQIDSALKGPGSPSGAIRAVRTAEVVIYAAQLMDATSGIDSVPAAFFEGNEQLLIEERAKKTGQQATDAPQS